jgi:hypothetical protein
MNKKKLSGFFGALAVAAAALVARNNLGHKPSPPPASVDVPAVPTYTLVVLERDVPPVLPIHIDGKVFRDSTGAIWSWRGVTAFTLLQRVATGEDIGPYLDAADSPARTWCAC